MSDSIANLHLRNIPDKQDSKKNNTGLYLVLFLAGILLLTAIVLLPIFLSNISHGKKKIFGHYIWNNTLDIY